MLAAQRTQRERFALQVVQREVGSHDARSLLLGGFFFSFHLSLDLVE